MKIEKILKVAVRGGASDLILKTGSVPRFRFNGELISLGEGQTITAAMMEEWIGLLVPPHLKKNLNRLEDIDFGFATSDGLRFRVNLFRQRQKISVW